MPFGDNVFSIDQGKKRYLFSKLFGWPPHIGNRVRARNVNKILSANSDNYILEVGSSYGFFSFDLAKRGAKVVGLDIDSGPVLFAQHQLSLKKWNYHLSYIVSAAENIPLRDGLFDKVVSVDVLEHVTDDKAAVREIFRVLKPGGSLIIHVPLDVRLHISPLRLSRARARKKDIGHEHERDGYTKEIILKILSDAGFIIESVIITNRFFSAIAWEIDNHFSFAKMLFPILYSFTFLDVFTPKKGNGFLIKAKKTEV